MHGDQLSHLAIGLPAFPLKGSSVCEIDTTTLSDAVWFLQILNAKSVQQRSPLGRSVVTALEAQMDSVASPLDADASDTPDTSPSRRRQGARAAIVL